MTAFENCRWIWIKEGEAPDQYAEFLDTLEYTGGRLLFRISVDSDYTLYVNGSYAASGQYGDFEHYKIYDELDLTALLRRGENELRILAYHCGVGTSRYRPARAGVIYEALCDGAPILRSRGGTPARLHPAYASGQQKYVSVQLGFTFSYDATREHDGGFAPSVPVEKNARLSPRPIKKAAVLPRRGMETVRRIDDRHWLIDLGAEVVGFPTLELTSDTEQDLTVAYGEHIVDGGVRYLIGNRCFAYTYRTRKGRNLFTDHMLRLGCRYLEIFAEAPLTLHYAGVLPQVYEADPLPFSLENPLDQRIYEICLRTLSLCMMEHYVDCPWREQALYAFDSRNQMLCGYYAYRGGNADYARSNLVLIGEDRREDGLLSICYPSGNSLAIPSFSLHYLLAMREYVAHTGDLTLSGSYLPKMKEILEAFLKNGKDGLIQTFSDENKWNFYDWSPFMSGSLRQREEATADAFINCLFLLALRCFSEIAAALGAKNPYDGMSEPLRRRIRAHFRTEEGLYTLHEGKREYTVLTNAMAILAEVARGEEARLIADKIVAQELIDCSLSTKILVYEALLNTDTERYKDFVLSEIRRNYGTMLRFGSDTVWETIDGASAFQNAGSLCHGWSAVPIYIFHRLGMVRQKTP